MGEWRLLDASRTVLKLSQALGSLGTIDSSEKCCLLHSLFGVTPCVEDS